MIKNTKFLVISFFIILTMFIISGTGGLTENIITNSKTLEHGNAIVTNIWLDSNSRLDTLKNNRIKYLIVDIGGTENNGKLSTPREDIDYFINFINTYERNNNYDFILLPYSEINTENYNIDEEFENNFIEDYYSLSLIGFDGIFIDIEPVKFDYRSQYLLLLDKLRNKLGSNKIISLYSGHIARDQNTNNYWEWNSDFLNKVSEKTDIITVPVYDTDFTKAADYKEHVRYTMDTILMKDWKCYFFIGVPTHKRAPETLANALSVYSAETKKYPNDDLLGVSIFSEWTISPIEWRTYNKYF